MVPPKSFYKYLLKFLLLFAVFYYGTKIMSGLATAGGYYSLFIHTYLDYVSWLRASLVHGGGYIAALFAYSTEILPGFVLKVVDGKGVFVSYGCAGYGVMSFWAAFVLANQLGFTKKAIWLLGGLLLLWGINVTRIGLFLVAINKGWPMPLGLNHHTWFNIFAYLAIFTMMYFFDKQIKQLDVDRNNAPNSLH